MAFFHNSQASERPDDEDGHQRRDADAEDQERQFLALAFAL